MAQNSPAWVLPSIYRTLLTILHKMPRLLAPALVACMLCGCSKSVSEGYKDSENAQRDAAEAWTRAMSLVDRVVDEAEIRAREQADTALRAANAGSEPAKAERAKLASASQRSWQAVEKAREALYDASRASADGRQGLHRTLRSYVPREIHDRVPVALADREDLPEIVLEIARGEALGDAATSIADAMVPLEATERSALITAAERVRALHEDESAKQVAWMAAEAEAKALDAELVVQNAAVQDAGWRVTLALGEGHAKVRAASAPRRGALALIDLYRNAATAAAAAAADASMRNLADSAANDAAAHVVAFIDKHGEAVDPVAREASRRAQQAAEAARRTRN